MKTSIYCSEYAHLAFHIWNRLTALEIFLKANPEAILVSTFKKGKGGFLFTSETEEHIFLTNLDSTCQGL